MKPIFISAIFAFFSIYSNAQRVVISDEQQINERVTSEINALFQSNDFVKAKNKKFADAQGLVTVDVGINQSGKVATFFKVESDIKNVQFINFMSAYILSHKFEFKLQKQQHYKVRYSITF